MPLALQRKLAPMLQRRTPPPARRLFRPAVEMLESRIAPAGTVTIPGLFATGVDNAGRLFAPASVDPHYRLIAVPAPDTAGAAYAVINNGFPFDGHWIANGPASQWIAPHANENDFNGGVTEPVGTYTYETTFDLTELDPAAAHITGQVSADNTVVQVLLNGKDVGNASANGEQYRGFAPLDIHGGFVAGVNRLDFVVTNLPLADPKNAHNPSAFRAELAGTAAVAVPTAVDDHYTTDLGQPVKGNVLANDSDPGGAPLTVQGHTDPAHGTLALQRDGRFTYTPRQGWVGTDGFTYTVTNGRADSTANVTITVSPKEMVIYLDYAKLTGATAPPTPQPKPGNPFNLTPEDYAQFQADRRRWLSQIGSAPVGVDVNSYGQLLAYTDRAESKLARVREYAQALQRMLKDRAHYTKEQYLAELRSGTRAYDEYLKALKNVIQVQGQFIADQWYITGPE